MIDQPDLSTGIWDGDKKQLNRFNLYLITQLIFDKIFDLFFKYRTAKIQGVLANYRRVKFILYFLKVINRLY